MHETLRIIWFREFFKKSMSKPLGTIEKKGGALLKIAAAAAILKKNTCLLKQKKTLKTHRKS